MERKTQATGQPSRTDGDSRGTAQTISDCFADPILLKIADLVDMHRLLPIVIALACAGCAVPAAWKCPGVTAPDHKLRACLLSVGKSGPPFNESRIEIHDTQDRLLATKDFKSSDGEHGRNVQKAEWTADSQFFVFSTASSGGHSPWHWQTYFYDRRKNVFKELDDFTGPVIKRDFILTPPDKVEVTVQGTSADPSDIVTGHTVQKTLSTL